TVKEGLVPPYRQLVRTAESEPVQLVVGRRTVTCLPGMPEVLLGADPRVTRKAILNIQFLCVGVARLELQSCSHPPDELHASRVVVAHAERVEPSGVGNERIRHAGHWDVRGSLRNRRSQSGIAHSGGSPCRASGCSAN